ncbi:MAG: PepSY domain-containing protein [Oscillospiraceae bacterium]|nr:PepSY domain-containing protein [Oscillospiraceae bacterium]
MKKVLTLITVIICLCLLGCTKTEISAEKAQSIAEAVLTDGEKATILNYSEPEIERIVVEKNHYIDGLIGKTVWKVTYTTTLDPFLGPITFYIDVYSGDILWRDLRM